MQTRQTSHETRSKRAAEKIKQRQALKTTTKQQQEKNNNCESRKDLQHKYFRFADSPRRRVAQTI